MRLICNILPVKRTQDVRRETAEEGSMAKCEVCGNQYDKSFEVTVGGAAHTFDSFECAIQALAPTCSHCSCKIIGHGVEASGRMFCCVHCAKQAGVSELKDRAA
jgi:hypothetical protein